MVPEKVKVGQVHHLIECVLHDARPRYTGEDGVHAVRCTLATIESARRGQPVRLEEIPDDYTAYDAGSVRPQVGYCGLRKSGCP